MPQIAKLIGCAGSGKTRELLQIMEKALSVGDLDPMQIGFVSFTRQARGEAASRAGDQFGISQDDLEKAGWFRTLHSICYRCLNVGDELLSDDTKSRRWVMKALGDNLDGGVLTLSEDAAQESLADLEYSYTTQSALSMWDVSRNLLMPVEKVWNRTHNIPGSFDKCRETIERYESAKRVDGRIDFVDLLAKFAGYRFTVDSIEKCDPDGEVPLLPIWFQDEMQDSSALMMAVFQRLISAPTTQWVYVCADPNQCQPPGTLVETVTGRVAIENLDPELHRLLCWEKRSGRIRGHKHGYNFLVAQRNCNELIEVKSGKRSTKYTASHKCYARFSRSLKKNHCVYLMRKGDFFRIGSCKLYNKKHNISLLAGRCRGEGADEAWILSLHSTARESVVEENLQSSLYGIPMVTFRPANGTNVTRRELRYIFSGISDLSGRASRCLKNHGRNILFPAWHKRIKQTGFLKAGTHYASNLIPEAMEIPHEDRNSKKVTWEKIDSISYAPGGIVYSLEVEKHHNYIADGIVTQNSIHGFAGASNKHFRDMPADKVRYLDKNYRCAQHIHELGERILAQCHEYENHKTTGADHNGFYEVRAWNPLLMRDCGPYGDGIHSGIQPDQQWLVLTRTNKEVRNLGAVLKNCGVPWVPIRPVNGGWRRPSWQKAMNCLYNMERGWDVGGEWWHEAVKFLPSMLDGHRMLVHGTKKRFKTLADARKYPVITPCDYEDIGITNDLLDHIRRGRWQQFVEGGEMWSKAASIWGVESVQSPKVQLGTIHSAKGAQADNVFYYANTSHAVEKAREYPDGGDEEHRVEYVGVTRARKRLVISWKPGAPYRAQLPA